MLFRIAMRLRAPRAVILLFAGPVLAVEIAACDLLAQPAEPPREPTAVGVVESMDPITSRVSAAHLANGETVRLDYDQTDDYVHAGHGQLEAGAPVVYVVNDEGEVIVRP